MEKVHLSTVFIGFSVGLVLNFLVFGGHFWVKIAYVAKYWHSYNKMTHRTRTPFLTLFFSLELIGGLSVKSDLFGALKSLKPRIKVIMANGSSKPA